MRRLVLLPLLFAAHPAFAADPEIVVTGTGLAPAAGDAAYDVVTIDRTRIAQSASGRLEDILRDASGFAQYRRSDARSAHPTSQGATLRGLGGNASSRALVLLDGVPQTDPFGGWVSWAAYDATRLGYARVTRGGGSGVYGPGALAGTIELSSAGPNDLDPIWADFAYGSRNSVDADAGVSGRLGGGFASLSGSYARGDGFVPIIRQDRGPVDRAAPYEQYSFAGRAVVPVSPDTELQVNGLVFRDTRDRGTDFTDNATTGADASVRLVGKGHWGWEALAWLQTRAFSSQFASVNAARTTVTQSLDQYSVPATGIGGRFEIRPPIGTGIELRLGADWRRTNGETKELYTFVAGAPTRRRNAGGTTYDSGAFAELSVMPGDTLTLTGGARIDRWAIDNGFLHENTLATGAVLTNANFADRHGWRPTGRVGIAWKPMGSVTLRSAAYLGWRLPTLNELYRPFRAGADATAANAALKPERMKGVEAGADYSPISTVRFGATLFWNKLEDAIGNVTLGTGPGTFPGVGFVAAGGVYRERLNLDAIRSRGIELDGHVSYGQWSVDASYAYVDARVRASGIAAPLDGLRPAQTPKSQASATLGWARPLGPSAALTLRYVANQYEDDQNSRTLKNAVTLDAVVNVPLRHDFSLQLRGENVTNTRVDATISGANLIERATPRTLWIGFRYGMR
ncbi:TonB-dependent receptor [Flavisphingomonas formosensis]|uniref:TonB-dependent receptor n=1 Tax=Flavisphingomonas formosensis TaxID=861534 RepID=UPI0012FA0D77|nr:TonB-dependent receptor [Sphingomonas formosensis]